MIPAMGSSPVTKYSQLSSQMMWSRDKPLSVWNIIWALCSQKAVLVEKSFHLCYARKQLTEKDLPALTFPRARSSPSFLMTPITLLDDSSDYLPFSNPRTPFFSLKCFSLMSIFLLQKLELNNIFNFQVHFLSLILFSLSSFQMLDPQNLWA